MTDKDAIRILRLFVTCYLTNETESAPLCSTNETESAPLLFPDEIHEILRNTAEDADVLINKARWRNYKFERNSLVSAIYDAIESGVTVTVNGQNILNM